MRGSPAANPAEWPSELVPAQKVRAVFNASGLREPSEYPPPLHRVLRLTHAPRPENRQLAGSLSELWAVMDQRTGSKVAIVHRYARPDGTTTRPDPNRFTHGSDIVIPDPSTS